MSSTIPLSLTFLYRRLEAATSRLEDMATAVDPSNPLNAQTIAASEAEHSGMKATDGQIARSSSAPPAAAQPLPRVVQEFDKIILEDVKAFVEASEKLGGLVAEQVSLR